MMARLFYWPQTLELHPCFCSTQGALTSHWHVILYSFFQWLGVDPRVVLHLKQWPRATRHWLNGTMVKKKKEEEGKSPLKNHFAMGGIWTVKLCLQSQALYPLEHSALPKIMARLAKVFKTNDMSVHDKTDRSDHTPVTKWLSSCCHRLEKKS